MSLRKKKNKEVSNGDLAKQISILSNQVETTNKNLSERVETVNTNLSAQIRDMSEQVEVVALAVANVQNRLAEINHKVIGTNQKINGLNNRFDDFALNRAKTDEVNARFLRLEKKVGLSKN